MAGRVEVRNLDVVIKNMQQITPATEARLLAAGRTAERVLLKAVKDQASLTCHSLEDLAAMDHPYSTRFPPDSGPHPDELVHIQSGQLMSGIGSVSFLSNHRLIVAAGVNEAQVPHVKFLIWGTSKMRPRDFLGHAWMMVRETVFGIIKYGLVPTGSMNGKAMGEGSRHGNVGR